VSAEDETTGPAPSDEHGQDAPREATGESKGAKQPAAESKPAAKKATAKDDGEQEAVAKPAGKKAAAEKKPAAEKKAEAEKPDDGQEGENAPAKQRRRRKPAATVPAAPGDAGEAKEAAKAKDAADTGKKPARRAAAGVKGAPRRRVVRAHARYVRTSARKARMVCGHLRGKSVQEARAILAFTPREVARDWSKLLESAVANAESNHELLEDDLIVREAYADEGPTIKRFRPRAMGRATPIRKRTSHLTITLTPRP
jgi:ribosomal protein L22